MEKLSRQEYKKLIEIVIEKKESMRKESYSDKEVDKEFTDLMFILIKLDAQFEILYGGGKENEHHNE